MLVDLQFKFLHFLARHRKFHYYRDFANCDLMIVSQAIT